MASSNRRLDVSKDSPDADVVARRVEFDTHLDVCTACTPTLCSMANTLWRGVVFAALRGHGGK